MHMYVLALAASWIWILKLTSAFRDVDTADHHVLRGIAAAAAGPVA